MKWLIASDLHGSALYAERLLARCAAERADRVLLLGDLLYHGPRNALPEGYDPPGVAELLNTLEGRVFCVRGNCEAEVDQWLLKFPVMADYALLEMEGRLVYATHGHLSGEDNPPPLAAGSILLCGHTHVPACRDREHFIYMNPGSVSMPKEGSERSCMTCENGLWRWMKLDDGAVYMERDTRG